MTPPTTLRVLTELGAWRGVGLPDLQNPGYVDPDAAWVERSGESFYDAMDPRLTIVFAGDITNSRDIRTILNLADDLTTPSGPIVVQFDSGDYWINNLQNYGTLSNPSWIAYANGNRKILGLMGAGFDPVTGEFLTRMRVSPTMINDTPNARDFALNATAATSLPITMLYFSNSSSTAPFFFSGLTFDGDLEGPFGVFSTASQASFRRNHGVPSPLPWYGLNFVNSTEGSLVRNLRTRGFGFALNSAPPFECGAIQSNRSSRLGVFGVEVDGKLAEYIDPARRRTSAGWMLNKEDYSLFRRFQLQDTRRSGIATNTNTMNQGEQYIFDNVQAYGIANVGDDGWPSDITTLPGGFNGFNIEGVIGTFTVRNSTIDVPQGSQYNWAVPAKSSSGVVYPVPNHTVLFSEDVTTNDTLYGGLLRVATGKAPNSTGDSPVWTAINSDFLGATNALINVKRQGVRLAPVRASQYNAAIHNPYAHFIMRSF